MIHNVLTLLFGSAALAFGIILSAAFAKVQFTKRNFLVLSGLFLFSGTLQLILIALLDEEKVWQFYPLVAHLPLILLLVFHYRKPLPTALAAVFTSYLLCQPAKWTGILFYSLLNNATIEFIVRILVLFPIAYVAITQLAPCLSDIYNKDNRSTYIFGIVPTVYYVFDYVTAIYTDLWFSHSRLVMEFMPFFLACIFTVFCFVYYREYEQKADAQRHEQIIQIAIKQQSREITAVRQMDQELRLLRHDMRMFLSSLAVSIENGETDTAQAMIHSYTTRIDGTKLQRYCSYEIVNYVLSDYAARCKNESTAFDCTVALQEMTIDEITFCSILSNALDNALNAQKLLPPDKRHIALMLKNSKGRLLLSIENPVGQHVVFADGLPVSNKSGHGYGTQSIRYLTERLGGNCQFCVQEDTFILRVVL